MKVSVRHDGDWLKMEPLMERGGGEHHFCSRLRGLLIAFACLDLNFVTEIEEVAIRVPPMLDSTTARH